MRTVTIEVASVEDTKARMKAAFRGEPQGCFISFLSHEDLWATLTPNRWAILKALTGVGPVSIRETARRVRRDVKAVHGDVTALLNAGVLDKTDDGKIVFPYDAVHVDFVLKAAA